MTALPSTPASHLSRLRLAAADIKLAHSVFAMPFALLAVFLARDATERWRTFLLKLLLVVCCMVFARTCAMLVNRIADRGFDAANPRTRRRAVASGSLSARHARGYAIASAMAFVAVCSLFLLLFTNPWPITLSVPVLAWIAAYSYTKRFTAFCHVWLGVSLAIAPLAAALAVNPSALTHTPALWLIAGMVVLWVAGFDVIYALQDEAFDRERGLHSVPARWGKRGGGWASRVMHLGAFSLLAAAAIAEPRFGVFFYAAVAAVGGLLVYEHVVLRRRGLAGLDMAFFTINGVVSCLLGVAGIADVLMHSASG